MNITTVLLLSLLHDCQQWMWKWNTGLLLSKCLGLTQNGARWAVKGAWCPLFLLNRKIKAIQAIGYGRTGNWISKLVSSHFKCQQTWQSLLPIGNSQQKDIQKFQQKDFQRRKLNYSTDVMNFCPFHILWYWYTGLPLIQTK